CPSVFNYKGFSTGSYIGDFHVKIPYDVQLTTGEGSAVEIKNPVQIAVFQKVLAQAHRCVIGIGQSCKCHIGKLVKR
ncbi:MAG: hypothetical protein AAB069_00510, partial [Planctomycetota bacterium]